MRLRLLPVLLLCLATPAEALREGGDPPKTIFLNYEPSIFYKLTDASVAISASGPVFVSFREEPGAGLDPRLHVYRSEDRGRTWSEWSVLDDPGEGYGKPRLEVASGSIQDFVYLAYKDGSELKLARASVADPVPTWTTTSVATFVGDWHVVTRSVAFGPPVVAAAWITGAGSDVLWRSSVSTDGGSSFPSAVDVHTLSGSPPSGSWSVEVGLALGGPDTAYLVASVGTDGATGGDTTDLLLYSAPGNGTGAWSATPLTVVSGPVVDRLSVAAEPGGNGVLVAAHPDGLWVSSDAGATWSSPVLDGESGIEFPDAIWTANGPFVGDESRHHFPTGNLDDPWDELPWASDVGNNDEGSSVAEDLANPGPFAMVGIREAPSWRVGFGAQWRDGPGYGFNEEFNPLFTVASPFLGAPTLVDLDGNGSKDILLTGLGLGDAPTLFLVPPLTTAGSPVTVNTTQLSTASAPAVFDVDADGDVEIFVGSANGGVQAFDHTGTAQFGNGWPVDFPQGGDTWVSIGPVSGWSVAEIVAVNGSRIHLLNALGVEKPGFPWSSGGGSAVGRAAIGDVDNDGTTEVVAAFSTGVAIVNGDGTTLANLAPGAPPATGVSLADLDGDGDLEIAIPRSDGRVEVVHHDGSPLGPGWPLDTGTGAAVSAVAIANVLDASTPALAFASGASAYLVGTDANALPGYPVPTPAAVITEPLLGRVGNPGQDEAQLIVGDADTRLHVLDAAGDVVQDWPKLLRGDVDLMTPALGDVDGDGIVEMVVPVEDILHVLDMGTAPLAGLSRQWPMAGHDPARSGCADCLPGTPTAVGPSDPTSRIAFLPPVPNPVADHTTLSFSLTRADAVELAIFDLRGRLVRRLHAGRLPAGSHTFVWDLRDSADARVAAGSYFGRIRMSGALGPEVHVRRIAVVRR